MADAYPDKGCTYHPACLTCPFERCRYDGPDGPRFRARRYDAQIVALRNEGWGVDAIAGMLGISRRTVFRAAVAARQEATA
jgi:transposase-like protein